MDQQFSLSWNNFHGNLSEGFAGLLGKKEFVDVTIAVEGHLIQAHKVILSICSPYFKEMFHMNPCQHPIVVLRDVSHKTMKELLQFMYLGEVSVKREDLTSFIGTAELLQIKGLTNKESTEESEKDTTKHRTEIQNSVPSSNSGTDIHDESEDARDSNEDATNHTVLDLLKHKEFAERLQRLSQLKRKSDEFMQKNYYNTDIFNFDKRPKLREKQVKPNSNILQSNNYEQFHSLFHASPNIAATNYSMHKNSLQRTNDENLSGPEQTESPESLDIKTECDDDIVVAEPAACLTPKSFDARDGQQDTECQSTQDNCSGEHLYEHELESKGPEHRLVTIPQREGKKKYPQRSCRLCWRLGRRRDTRFMCLQCQLPLCKLPCFAMHLDAANKHPQTYDFLLKRI